MEHIGKYKDLDIYVSIDKGIIFEKSHTEYLSRNPVTLTNQLLIFNGTHYYGEDFFISLNLPNSASQIFYPYWYVTALDITDYKFIPIRDLILSNPYIKEILTISDILEWNTGINKFIFIWMNNSKETLKGAWYHAPYFFIQGTMKKNYILDTNVIVSDPYSIFKFEDNNIYLPIYVLEELDNFKGEATERGRSSRVFSRILDDLRASGNLAEGILMPDGGKLVVYVPQHRGTLLMAVKPNSVDSDIIACSLEIKNSNTDPTILVTMDMNLRIRADVLGVSVENYNSQNVKVEESDLGIVDIYVLPHLIDEFYVHGNLPAEALTSEDVEKLYPNANVILHSIDGSNKSALCRYNDNKLNKLLLLKEGVIGIKPKNVEQTFALDMLIDDRIKLVMISGAAGSGKAQPLTSKILTPDGWKVMGEITPGDLVSTPDGNHAEVLSVHPQGVKDIYKVSFSDGSSTECCEDHLWVTQNVNERNAHRTGTVRSTKEIMNTLMFKGKKNHSIPITKPINLNQNNNIGPISSYSMGVLLGDGTFRHHLALSSADDFIINELRKDLESINLVLTQSTARKYDYFITPDGKKNILKNYLIEKQLWMKKSHEKFIPDEYKYSSIDNRINLLQGLLDTDGSCHGRTIEYSSSSKQLAEDLCWLVQSLGGTAKTSTRKTFYTYKGVKKEGRINYRVYLNVPNEIIPFKLKRKAERVIPKIKYFPRRYITNVEFVRTDEAQCIYINSNDHLYITDNCIVTHNTILTIAAGLHKVLKENVYNKLTLTRTIASVGKNNELGYLPGTESEKILPLFKGSLDNLELLLMNKELKSLLPKDAKGLVNIDKFLQDGPVSLESMAYIRGRSLPNQMIIVEEAQNSSIHELKTILSRAADGTKAIVIGDLQQIDVAYLSQNNCGLSILMEKLKKKSLSGYIKLQKCHRSELADMVINGL